MANYDYNLDDAENAAVNRSKNMKRAAAIGGAVLGAGAIGGATAYGATHMGGDETPAVEPETNDLTSEDILEGGKAVTLETAEETPVEEPVQQQVVHQTNVYINHIDDTKEEVVAHDPEISVDKTSIVLDENGDPIDVFDQGTFDGKDFMVFDLDGNGKGDVLAYDQNGNGVFEEDELFEMDNKTYELGQGQTIAVYQVDEEGDPQLVAEERNPFVQPTDELMANQDISDIPNDFLDEKTGEVYRNDLAENNPDYNNHTEAEQYRAGLDDGQELVAQAEDSHEAEPFAEPAYGDDEFYASNDDATYETDDIYNDNIDDYGYTADNEVADFDSFDSFDEAATYDA